MAKAARRSGAELLVEAAVIAWGLPGTARFRGGVTAAAGAALAVALATYNPADPSFNAASGGAATNALGGAGALIADLAMQSLGLGAWLTAILMTAFGMTRVLDAEPDRGRKSLRIKAAVGVVGVLLLSAAVAAPPPPAAWPLALGLGGLWGQGLFGLVRDLFGFVHLPGAALFAGLLLAAGGITATVWSLGLQKLAAGFDPESLARLMHREPKAPPATPARKPAKTRQPIARSALPPMEDDAPVNAPAAEPVLNIRQPKAPARTGRETRERQPAFDFDESRKGGFQLPELSMLAQPKPRASVYDEASLRQNARLLESVLSEFGVRGAIDQIRPGPVVTLYELTPAPGVKHARVVALSDDIARSMSVAACRVAVVQGRNAIGIELPNAKRETVYLRDLLSCADYEKPGTILPMALGEGIGGEPYIADLAKMPHLLIAGTTGSGKSVGVNAMILSILYRLPPDLCRFIMIDPKMLELSVYDGIPHLLAPVVTDPKKAIVALKWTVREMEDRYRRMSKIGVRNIGGYNERAKEALEKGEHFERTVQTGFDDAGRAIYESEKIRPEHMPYLVVVIDEVADLMMVAGKDIEGAVQRLAQMARAAGIHLIMATQRPSVDVITGTIKANFPTRISFQVTSKIDARTILGEQGAEQLLGMGDMLYMAGGGRTTRLHGPFVSDGEVEAVARFLRDQGQPNYLEEVTAGGEDDEDGEGAVASDGSGGDLYDHAVAVVTRDRKASTSYIQRRLQIGYNRAASLMERMEREGIVGAANHAGKREILVGAPP
ncbi:MAG: cell division protein FtsK/SpoIIIE [Caulobacter sp.]|nr:cell division protein FtsK/SpoIIIE [Caulobacter sp.]